jgi:hypothetical protein
VRPQATAQQRAKKLQNGSGEEAFAAVTTLKEEGIFQCVLRGSIHGSNFIAPTKNTEYYPGEQLITPLNFKSKWLITLTGC